ncbi:RNA polymerase factor sigma-54 [Clostridium minihomine]|uniref:RNA polymerase factor sigma-54 n=1 Tax=Clostridium minihomine TaxID=2045012 RepID=UPI000C787258|nr:RNA polymerase factor sigma-54 [Clostridium minihomine]
MNLGNRLIHEQRQLLSQRQMQSLQMLTCSNQELNDLLANEYAENPMLEHISTGRDDFFTNIDTLYESGSTPRKNNSVWEDEDDQRKNDIPSKPVDALKKDLLMQLHRERYTEDQQQLIPFLIDCLDESGFFPWDPGEIARISGYPESMVRSCLEDLKELEPTGVFSKDLSECLLKQLEQQEVQDPILCTIVCKYLPDILKGQISNVSRGLHLSTAAVRKYIVQIGKLNPRPVMNAPQEHTEYIVPDIMAWQKNGEWNISLNDKWMGEYKLNQYYIEMMKTSSDQSLNTYFKSHLERARFLMQCVEQRRNTILKITQEILRRQEAFFLNQGPLCPMTMQQVAESLEIHPSTVSRAIRGKYLQYQYGTVLLRDLFSAGLSEPENQDCASPNKIHQILRELIAGEDKTKPLSDSALVQALEQQGIQISRRTIAKYRCEMGIPNSDQRRYLA